MRIPIRVAASLLAMGVLVSEKLCADTFYSIQVGAFSDSGTAEARRLELAAQLPGLHVRTLGEGAGARKLLWGAWTTYADAWTRRTVLPAGVEGFVARWEEEAPAVAPELRSAGDGKGPFVTDGLGSDAIVSMPEVFASALQGIEMPSQGLVAGDPQSMSREELLSVGMRAEGQPEGIAALRRFLGQHPGDALAEKARVQLARRLIRTKNWSGAVAALDAAQAGADAAEVAKARLLGAYVILCSGTPQEAYDAFRAVANDTALSPSVRCDAMRMAAGSAQKGGDRAAAWLAYSAIRDHVPDDAMRAEARMQLAGLALELANNGKGTTEEASAIAADAAADPNAPEAVRATAELIRLESMFYGGRNDEVLPEIDAFLAAYPSKVREHSTACVLKGAALARNGQLEEAKAVLSQVAAMELSDSERFGGTDQRAQALSWLADIAAEQGNQKARAAHLAQLQQRFPDSAEAKTAVKRSAEQSALKRETERRATDGQSSQ